MQRLLLCERTDRIAVLIYKTSCLSRGASAGRERFIIMIYNITHSPMLSGIPLPPNLFCATRLNIRDTDLAVHPTALVGREREWQMYCCTRHFLKYPPVPSLSIDKIKALAVIV